MRLNLPDPLRVSLKIMAALLGGYLLTLAFISLLAVLWPARLADAMQTGLMLGYAFYVAIMILAFSRSDWLGAWLWMLVPALTLWGLTQWLS